MHYATSRNAAMVKSYRTNIWPSNTSVTLHPATTAIVVFAFGGNNVIEIM